MSIGNIYIRPQVLERRPSDDDAVALDLLTGLGSRLLVDFLQGGPASKKIADASQAGVTEFINGFESRLQNTRTKLLEWVDPYLSIIKDITTGLGDDTAENLLAVATSLIALTDKLLEDLHSTNIAARLNDLADILENDLGVSWSTFEEFFDGIFDSVTNALSNDFLTGSQTEEALNNFIISRHLLTVRRVAKDQLAALPLPTFDRHAIIRDWQLNLEASNWDETLDTIQDKLKSGPDQLGKVLPLLTQSLSIGGSSSLRSVSGRESSRSFRDVAGPGQYSWYASWFRGEGTGAKDRFDLSSEPFAAEIHFTDALSCKFLENWALITAALEEAARAVKYGFDLDDGNHVSPALNLIWQSSMGVMTLLSYLVDGEEWVTFYSIKNHTAFQKGVPVGLSFAGSFEQFPGFWGWLWATLPHDVGNTTSGMTWPKLIREGLLSLFTLINADNSPNTKNHEKISGITAATHTGGAYIAALIMGRKDRYYSIFSDSFGLSVLVILGGGVITWAFDIIGWLISGALARRLSDRYWKFEEEGAGGIGEFFGGENAYGSLFWSFIDFYLTYGSFWEERTNDGKFGLKSKIQPDGTLESVEITFNGYPAKTNSPYRLPYEPGRLVFCSQAHNGFSGHNFRKKLIYAVDFLLNEGELAVAMRDGTVTEYRDDRPNGSDLGLNYIVIRHDTLDPVHDLGENGQLTNTYARYEHATPFGIRQAFAAMGIPESQILGTKVQQGFPLIRVGKRPGFFNFDFLQVQVSGGVADGLLPTIPFVFRDLPDDGLPHKGKYYNSGNTAKARSDLALLHPDNAQGRVLEAGRDFVKLEQNANENDEAYKDAHLLIWYELPEGDDDIWYEYQKIKEYKGDDRKVIIEGNWSAGSPPPVSASYRIGSVKYGSASVFDKRFAYLANRDSANNAINFPDSRSFYRLMKTGYYHGNAAAGQIIGAGTEGASEVHLDASAGTTDHEYNQRHIIIRRNGQIIQYRAIRDYRFDGGVRKVFIDGVWDVALQTGGTADTYEIGALPYWKPPADAFKAYHAPDEDPERYLPIPFPDKALPYQYYPFPFFRD